METIPFFIVFNEEQLVSRISEPSTVPVNKKSTRMMLFKRKRWWMFIRIVGWKARIPMRFCSLAMAKSVGCL